MSEKLFAGIDIGGTKIAVALATANGDFVFRHRFPTRIKLGAAAILDETLDVIEMAITKTGGNLTAIGIGCPGPLDIRRGLILSPPNLSDWDEFPIVKAVKEKFNVPVVLDNDANAAALGEHCFGAGRGFENLVYITISTGIGGGIIINNRLIHGVGAGAGEIGHIAVAPDEIKCKCGASGCLEAICSGTSIARRARQRIIAGDRSLMTGLVKNTNQITAQTVAEAAYRGDSVANEIWSETIGFLAVGINNIAVTLAPEAFIIGGGVSLAGEEMLFKPLRKAVNERVKMLPGEQIKILPAELKSESGIYGTLALAFAALDEDQQVKRWT